MSSELGAIVTATGAGISYAGSAEIVGAVIGVD